MFEGKCMFAGLNRFKSKAGNVVEVLKVLDKDTGDYAEFFVGNETVIPSMQMFDDCIVTVKLQNRNVRLVKVEV